jgi:anaerobic selenocysteine-containing dehydrogenase
VENGKVVSVEGDPSHPYNEGRLCPKAFAGVELVNHPDRLRHPLKKYNGRWEQISWDEALDIICFQLKKIKEAYGARAMALAMLNVIITEGLYDREFVEQWTLRFDQLAEHVKQFSPEKNS